MKKLYLALMLVLALGLSSCDGGASEIEKSLSNMETVDSYRLDMTMEDIPLFGTMTAYILVDGDYMYTSFFGFDMYGFTSEGTEYALVEIDDEYFAMETLDASGLGEFENDIFKDFSAEDFVKDDEGYYVASVDYGNMANVKIKIIDNYLSELTAEVSMEDSEDVVTVTFEFSNYNETTIDFPEYTMMDSIQSIIYSMVEEDGYDYIETENGFMLDGWFDTITYTEGDDFFAISAWGVEVYYYPESESIVIDGEMTIALSDYLEDSPIVESYIFEYLQDLFEELELN